VDWSMAEHMRTKLVNDALLMADWKHKPEKGLYGMPIAAANTHPIATELY
jgi:transposase InsO family protein